jgi:hypothetical protein
MIRMIRKWKARFFILSVMKHPFFNDYGKWNIWKFYVSFSMKSSGKKLWKIEISTQFPLYFFNIQRYDAE